MQQTLSLSWKQTSQHTTSLWPNPNHNSTDSHSSNNLPRHRTNYSAGISASSHLANQRGNVQISKINSHSTKSSRDQGKYHICSRPSLSLGNNLVNIKPSSQPSSPIHLATRQSLNSSLNATLCHPAIIRSSFSRGHTAQHRGKPLMDHPPN